MRLHQHAICLLVATLASSACDLADPIAPQPRRLSGDRAAPAFQTLTPMHFVARPQDYSEHPAGGKVSHNTVAVSLRPEATLDELDELVNRVGAAIVGVLPGSTTAASILILRLATRSHAARELLSQEISQNPRVKVVAPDVMLQPSIQTVAPLGLGVWTWEPHPYGGNWGLELSRVPQMWNLKAAVEKNHPPRIYVGINDWGFKPSPDLTYFASFGPIHLDEHGTRVAGVLGALFDNGIGIDGVNPVVGDLAELLQSSPRTQAESFDRLRMMAVSATPPRVINQSLGFTKNKPDRLSLNSWALMYLTDLLPQMEQAGVVPLITKSADNGHGQDAALDDPLSFAALRLGAPNIIVVESIGLQGGVPWPSRFSNINGHVSAPGEDVVTTNPNQAQPTKQVIGTSFSAPFVGGVVSFLLSIDPNLSVAQLKTLILGQSVPVSGGASPHVDAFASALAIDGIRANTRVLDMLLDIDDGSRDGNLRVNPDGSPNYDDDMDRDGGPGDGRTDMRDFRRWRDAILQIEGSSFLDLDGPPDHPKRDLNGNGQPDITLAENIYPRADFNGDGQLSRSARIPVAGALARASLTDLEVLQYRFFDPDYSYSDLPNLIDSGDLMVDGSACLTRPNAATVRSSVRPRGPNAPVTSRSHSTGTPDHVYTTRAIGFIPPPTLSYLARIEALDGNGTVIGSEDFEYSPIPGSDSHWTPACLSTYELVPVPAPGITWDQAKLAAEARTSANGVQGHLVTIGSPEENALTVQLFDAGFDGFAWIAASDASIEGDWRWVVGPQTGDEIGAATYRNWGLIEPNNDSNEDVAAMNLGPATTSGTATGQWGDTKTTTRLMAYIVEYTYPPASQSQSRSARRPAPASGATSGLTPQTRRNVVPPWFRRPR